MDFDYEGAEDFGGRILYGRIAVFGAALLLALILGRCTAGGGDVSQEEYDAVVAENSELEVAATTNQASIDQLQQEVLDLRSAATPAPGTGEGTDGTTEGDAQTPGDPGVSPTNEEGERTYEVQPGDTLSTIAQQVYNDPTAFGIIATANNIGGDNQLQVGQTLVIPPNPDQ